MSGLYNMAGKVFVYDEGGDGQGNSYASYRCPYSPKNDEDVLDITGEMC
jgi:hypothetical protein